MLILAVDTSGRQSSVALLRGEEVLAETGGLSDEPYASRLFSDVKRVLARAVVELPQIEAFAVGTGPGSFTGLRVGLTAVKGWAEVFGRRIAPISGLEAVASQTRTPGRTLAPTIDARGGKLYGAVFAPTVHGSGLQLRGEEVVLAAEEYFQWLARQTNGEPPVLVTPTVDVVRAGLASSPLAGATVEEVSGDLAPFIGRLGHALAARGRLVDALALEANYIRRSDAEVNWRGG